MKATEIKNMPVDELNAKLDSLKEELFALRFQLAANQLENTARIKAVKKGHCSCKDSTASVCTAVSRRVLLWLREI